MSPQQRYHADLVDPKVLGESITFPASGLVAKSRFLKAAMTERMSSWDQKDLTKRGLPSDELIHVFEEWGKGGFGLILTGNTIVNPEDLEAPGNPIVYRSFETEARIGAFKRQAAAAKKHGSLCMIQLSHGGRQVAEFINPHPVSASDVQLQSRMGMSFAKPTPLTKEGIEKVIDQFAYGAEFAHKTGYDGVELHAAHGYLLAQFLASTTNKRTDEYGGSLHNRARIIYRIVEEIKRRVQDPKFSVGIKINSAEFQKGGFQPDECREVCKRLEELGLDFVELSGGTYEELVFYKRESTKDREGFFLEFADVIRPALRKAKVYVTGGFRTASAMVHAVQSGVTDGVGLARPVCEEPHLPSMIITGAVPSARKTLLDENNFGQTNMAAGTQIAQIGRGEVPFDSTDEKAVARFQEAIKLSMEKTQELDKKGIVEAGHPYMAGGS